MISRRNFIRISLAPLLILPTWVESATRVFFPFGGVQNLAPTPPYVGATIDLDPANDRYLGGGLASNLSIARIGSNATDLLPTSASGASYQTFGPNTFRVTSGLGLLCEESRINYLLNSTAPVTQTTQSLATGTYTLWVNGSGTATPSGGTATITGAVAASNGSPNTFVVTVAGTVTVTTSGSLNAFQLELGGASAVYAGSSLIITGGTIGVRAADQLLLINGAFTIAASSAFSAIFLGKRLATNLGYLIAGPSTSAFSLQDHNPSQLAEGLNNVAFLAVSGTPMAINTLLKVGMTLNPTLNAVKVQGGAFASNATATPQTADTTYALGNKGGSNYFNGYFSRITLFPTPLSGAALNGLI